VQIIFVEIIVAHTDVGGYKS